MKVLDHILDDVYGMVDVLVHHLVSQGYTWDGKTGVFEKEGKIYRVIGTRAEPMGICLEDEIGNQFLAQIESGECVITLLFFVSELIPHIPEEPESKEGSNSKGSSHDREVK